jgi:hypothetical protein
MKPRIIIDKTLTPSDEGPDLQECSATFYNPQRHDIEHARGATPEQAEENLYQRLKQLGYSRSDLPKPESVKIYRTH